MSPDATFGQSPAFPHPADYARAVSSLSKQELETLVHRLTGSLAFHHKGSTDEKIGAARHEVMSVIKGVRL